MTIQAVTSTATFKIADRYDGDPEEYSYSITGEILEAGTDPNGALFYRVLDSVQGEVWIIRLDWESEGE